MSQSGPLEQLLSDIDIIDADNHVVEPYDLWTSRVSTKKWGDLVPHVVCNEVRQVDVWVSGDQVLHAAAATAWAGYDKPPPDVPKRWSDLKPESWRAEDRLKLMSRYGIHTAILYPMDVAGYGGGKFADVARKHGELAVELVRAYNDFVVDFCNVDPQRYFGLMLLPFWDVDLSIAEMDRSAAAGHRGILFSQQPEMYGSPMIGDPHWDNLWTAAQEMQLPVHFHLGSGGYDMGMLSPEAGRHAGMAADSAAIFLTSSRAFAAMIGSGTCHRFPKLKVVLAECGVGWIPSFLQQFDWMWERTQVRREHPEYDLLPSECFKRQIYSGFWFEHGAPLDSALECLGDEQVLYETLFPKSGGMVPGPASNGTSAKEFVAGNLAHLPEPTLRRILHDNAAALYNIDR
jgi:predicted TIM-barrel fold metal-dependent hydrolase